MLLSARKSQGLPSQSSVCTAEEEAAAARCEVFPSAGGRADSSLASPYTKMGSGAVLLPIGVFAIPTAQAAKTLLGHQDTRQSHGRNRPVFPDAINGLKSSLLPHMLLSCCFQAGIAQICETILRERIFLFPA